MNNFTPHGWIVRLDCVALERMAAALGPVRRFVFSCFLSFFFFGGWDAETRKVQNRFLLQGNGVKNEFPCYCDANCLNMGDCCADYKAFCEGETWSLGGCYKTAFLNETILTTTSSARQTKQNTMCARLQQKWISLLEFRIVSAAARACPSSLFEQVLGWSQINWRVKLETYHGRGDATCHE